MTKEYTLDEIRRLADTDPEKLAQEYQASRAATANLVDRARAGIAARSANPPTNKFNAWAQGYGNRFIYNGSMKPLAHMMLIIGGCWMCCRVVVPPQTRLWGEEGRGASLDVWNCSISSSYCDEECWIRKR
ncbi:unnamed protein product [Peronospora belbahrii]|uniref:Uncharacterized protein n=1 Tax=Peronospora belbahrii TaxID=622444 RepID=A0AAU9L214_9STRA|nr:unnamed protein product [Peronospora belbahrii]